MCFKTVRLKDKDAQFLLEEVEPNTVSLSRRPSSELRESSTSQTSAEEDLYNSSMELLLRMMNQHPSTRASQGLERALQETIILDDYRHSSLRQHRSRRRSVSEEADARRRNSSSSSRSRSVSSSAAENISRAGSGAESSSSRSDNSQPMTLRSRWQAASSRARESLLRASQEIRTRIRGKQQTETAGVVDASPPPKTRGGPPSAGEREMAEVPATS